MTLGQWIPQYLTNYKLHTIRPDSYYTLEMVARKIPDDLQDMELTEILPMHLQRFVNAFAVTILPREEFSSLTSTSSETSFLIR